MNIALTFDDNYLEQSIILMTSILANGNERVTFHIVDGGLSEDSKTTLKKFPNCEVKFYSVDENIFKDYVKSDYYPVSMMYTMVLPELIDVERLIYLDSDMVVNSSLKELYEMDFEDNYIAAVEDANGKKYVKKFGLKPTSKFFNTGVMLVNCAKWRADKISDKAVEFAMAHTGTRFGYDQTSLNLLLEGKVKFIDLKWNLQYCPINVWATYDDELQYKNAIKNPNIIHYVGDYKPWKKGLSYFNPKSADYFKYHKLTSYALEDYKAWEKEDKKLAYKGLLAFVKRYPLFFTRKMFWKNLGR